MLSRIASKYGIAMSELKACAYGEVECANSNLVSEVMVDEGGLCVSELEVLSSGIVYAADVESEWLLEVPSVEDDSDVKEKTYEVLSKLCEDVEKCGSMVELEVTWLRGMTMECIDLCKSDAILNVKYEEALFRYGVMSESFESGSNGVEESKSEVVVENSLSLMEESYQYAPVSVPVSVPTVEAPVVVVPTVETPEKKVVKAKVVKEKAAKAKVEKVNPISTVVSASESARASACVSEVVLSAGEASCVASCVASAGVAKKVAKEKVVKEKKEKPVKEKVVKEKKVKESVYRGGVFASLVTESLVAESVREESVCASESASAREESEEESSSRCYIVSKKEAASAAAKKMSSGLPKLSR